MSKVNWLLAILKPLSRQRPSSNGYHSQQKYCCPLNILNSQMSHAIPPSIWMQSDEQYNNQNRWKLHLFWNHFVYLVCTSPINDLACDSSTLPKVSKITLFGVCLGAKGMFILNAVCSSVCVTSYIGVTLSLESWFLCVLHCRWI